jgi:selenocysteine-specific elongation factor
MEQRSISPGESRLVQQRLDEPRFMMIGDHVVIRDWSGEATIGGGVVLEAEAKRRGVQSEEQLRFLKARAASPDDLAVLLESALERDRFLKVGALRSRLRFSESDLDAAVVTLIDSKAAHRLGDNLAAAGWWDEVLTRASDLVGAYHKKNADLPGVSLADLRQGIIGRLPQAALFDIVLQHLGERGIVQRGTILAEADFTPSLPDDIRAAADTLEKTLRLEPLNPPGRPELATDSSSRRALSFLLRSGAATELTDKVVILTDVYEQACADVMAFLKAQGKATASDLRQHLGTSRRVIMPLLERMDAEGKTRRDGDHRCAR